jgi:hypothetical protein
MDNTASESTINGVSVLNGAIASIIPILFTPFDTHNGEFTGGGQKVVNKELLKTIKPENLIKSQDSSRPSATIGSPILSSFQIAF